MSKKGDVPFWGSWAPHPNAPVPSGGKGTPPMLKLITGKTEVPGESPVGATLDELARVGAQRMIATALQIEVADYLARYERARDAAGHALVVRNGTARPGGDHGRGAAHPGGAARERSAPGRGVRQKFTS